MARFTRRSSKYRSKKATNGSRSRFKKSLKRGRSAAVARKRIVPVVRKVLRETAETKYKAFSALDEKPPLAIQGLANASWAGVMLGTAPTNWPSLASGLYRCNGFTIPEGNGNAQRVGKKIFLQRSTFTTNIDMNQTTLGGGPFEFRVILAKPRKSGAAAGTSYLPQTSLFTKPDNTPFGHSTQSIKEFDLMCQPTCKKHFYIRKDMRFKLSHPLAQANPSGTSQANGYSGFYPTSKTFRLSIPFNKQVAFAEPSLDTPSDTNLGWCLFIYCKGQGADAATANRWEINVRGTTSYLDM